MTKKRLSLAVFTACFFVPLFFQTCIANDKHHCAPSACGNIRNISYPFRLQNDPENCGDDRYILSCENNVTVLYLYEGRYYVQAINYNNFTIRLVNAGVDKDNCSSIPRFPLPIYHFFSEVPYSYYDYKYKPTRLEKFQKITQMIIFIKCANPVYSSLYVDTAPCNMDGVNSSLKWHHSYVIIGDMTASELMESCRTEMVSLFPVAVKKNMTFVEIHKELAYGFEISWLKKIYCNRCIIGRCYKDNTNKFRCRHVLSYGFQVISVWLVVCSMVFVVIFLVARTLCGTPCVIAFLIYKWRRRHLSGYDTIEEFLQNQNNLIPIRYSYSDIRKMTGKFKEKLGEGGFGSVYKGKLRSGQFAAIKLLSRSKTDGQDFFNEVATIGRIHHANVVQLIGFCAKGSKRALVYEFMSNGSLNNHIFPRQGSLSLSWKKLYQISLGVARGIDYLHRGCEMQILHFDIKPHNILLDENFNPKISDFGLAKLYPTKGSIASLTAARGTIGYMAPELFYKNIGRVSYKADVYSFGMLLLEMTGKRKSLNAMAENLSEIYYPFWVYDKLSQGKLEIEDVTDEENIIVRKMIITGLWCIQMQPSSRPSMNKVVEMLEREMESLQVPPRPVLYPAESMSMDVGESSSMSVDSAESSSLSS